MRCIKSEDNNRRPGERVRKELQREEVRALDGTQNEPNHKSSSSGVKPIPVSSSVNPSSTVPTSLLPGRTVCSPG